MANQAIVEQSSSDGRLGEQYEIVENGVKVLVRAVAPPLIIKQLLASRTGETSKPEDSQVNRLHG